MSVSHQSFDWDQFAPRARGTYGLPPTFRTEAQFEDYIIDRLSTAFRVHRKPQLTGSTCTGRRVMADIVIQPHHGQPWGGRDGSSYAPVVVEVKRTFAIESVTKAYGQALDYAHAVWDMARLRAKGWDHLPADGRMMSVIVLGAEGQIGDETRYWLDRIAGRSNVMTMSHSEWNGWSITHSGNRQWCERLGMSNTKFNPYVREGSR